MILIGFYGYSQNTFVPDDNFEQALIDLGYDTGPLDNYVPTANIDTITNLIVDGKSITDLTGIEYFSSLQTLDCSNNDLTTLNLTKNTALISLVCHNNILNELNVSQNNLLEIIFCINNQLTSLNLTQNIALSILYCSGNNLTNLNLSKNTALQLLICHSNSLSELDVSNNVDLRRLNCYNNNLTDLVLSSNIDLSELYCNNNSLTSLNVKNGDNFGIRSFDARNNSNLICIEVDNAAYSTANWTDIDPQTKFRENCVEMAYVPDDNFEKALIDLGYDTGNPDDYVPVANIDTITNLNISGKSITDLTGIEYFAALTTLICSNNNLTDINVSKNTNLINLICTNNSLTTLNISNIATLSLLYCQFNGLTDLDLSNNSALTELHAYDNQLTSLNVKNGNNTNMIGFNAINNPNLTCIDVDNKAYSTANWTAIDPQAGFSETCGSLGVADFLEFNVTIYPNPTNALIIIKLDNAIQIENIKTFDLIGKQLNKTRNNIVDLSNFQSGLYFIKMKTNLGTLTKKVIKM